MKCPAIVGSLVVATIGSAVIWVCASAQEGILTFRVEPPVLEVSSGGTAAAHVVVRNGSQREADDVEFIWTGPAGLSLGAEPQSVSAVAAFSSTAVPFVLVAGLATATGDAHGSFDVVYTYCIDEVCFQIVESIPVPLRVVSALQTPSTVPAGGPTDVEPAAGVDGQWRWPVFALAAGLVLASAAFGRGGRRRVALTFGVAVAGIAVLGLGVWLDQHTQAQAVGAVLCTSCVGIETVEIGTPRLTTAQAAAIDRLVTPVELLVFYAPWCRSCPYAEAMVGLVTSQNPLVRHRLVNAEVERELALDYGVTRGGRTVVPAIVRLDTGRVLFGAEDLGDRLVLLIGEGT